MPAPVFDTTGLGQFHPDGRRPGSPVGGAWREWRESGGRTVTADRGA